MMQNKLQYRHFILFMLFALTTVNYADRAILSIVGSVVSNEFHIDKITMGYLFSAFGWAYVLAQIPSGWLLDKYGSRIVYSIAVTLWSVFTLLQGTIAFVGGGIAVTLLFALRFMVGLAEGPSMPGNARVVAEWFPTKERGTASAIFNSAQYFATVIFSPLMAWITHEFGWSNVFFLMGGFGVFMAFIWSKILKSPSKHPKVSPQELQIIKDGGGLVDIDANDTEGKKPTLKLSHLLQLLKSRMFLGIYVGQYCITTLTYFFLTWFPIYLVEQKGMTILKAGAIASLPAIAGFCGGLIGGFVSDALLKRGLSLTASRKTPIVVGMLFSCTMVLCNYVTSDFWVIAFMTFAFFGKGVGALGWAVVSDTSPKEISGLSGGLFNTFGNVAGITTPIIIGYLVDKSGNFTAALAYVAANAAFAIFCYLFVVGEIKRFELKV